jgi:hypothetical protein
MTHSHTERAKVMYGSSEKPVANASAPAVTGRSAAAAILYGPSRSGQVGSIDNAIRSTFDPIEAGVRDDKERLAQTQNSREKVRSLLHKANVAPADAHAMLSVYGEYRAPSRSEDSLKKAWEGPHGFDRLRREAGSTEAAMGQLARTDAVLKVIQKEDPIFARELVQTGASQDPRFIQVASRIVGDLKPTESPAKQG